MNQNEFPALDKRGRNNNQVPISDKKMKELKIEAESRESKPVTWRRAQNEGKSIDGGNERPSPPKYSYAARLRVARAKPVSDAVGEVVGVASKDVASVKTE